MSKFDDLYWDIEQMYIDGVNPKRIAENLDCDIQTVHEVLADMGVAELPRRPKRGKIATKKQALLDSLN